MNEHSLEATNKQETLMLSEEQAVLETLRHMNSSEPHVIWVCSAEDLDWHNKSPKDSFFLLFFMVVPVRENTEIDKEMLDEPADAQKIHSYIVHYLRDLLQALNSEQRHIYSIMDTENSVRNITSWMQENAPNITFQSHLLEDNVQESAEKAVNEINAIIPDVVALILPPERQMEFLRNYQSMMNTHLCICISCLNEIVESRDIPELIKKLHLTGLYQWIRDKGTRQSRLENEAASHTQLKMEDDEYESE